MIGEEKRYKIEEIKKEISSANFQIFMGFAAEVSAITLMLNSMEDLGYVPAMMMGVFSFFPTTSLISDALDAKRKAKEDLEKQWVRK